MIFWRCTIFRLARPAFFRYNGVLHWYVFIRKDKLLIYLYVFPVWQIYVNINTYQCKTPLYLKKAGLASRNIAHLQKIILRCVGFCFYIFFIYMWSRLDHYWSNVYQQDHRSGCVLKNFNLTTESSKVLHRASSTPAGLIWYTDKSVV